LETPVVPTAAALREAFDRPAPLTIGLEEELMILDPDTLDLLPRAHDVIERVAGDARFKLELPAAQLEIVTAPVGSVPEAIAALGAGRRDLAAAAAGVGRLAAAGVHPFAEPRGRLNEGERYELTHAEYGEVAERQLVCGLQIHVAVGGADRSLAVYNALRSYLPALAALAANGPFHAGRDTGLASWRPKIAELLPRQGVPPAIPTWDALAEALRWGAAAGAVPEPRRWWWELRPHPAFGTLEVRVPDAQAGLGEAAGVAAVAHALVAHLAERWEAGETEEPAQSWRIEENRWSACRWGVEGTLADLDTGERRPTRERLHELLDAIVPAAERIGCAAELAHARELVERNGAIRQREVARGGDLRAVTGWLADRYVA
jgi:carboxylate-amine ligase